MPTDVLYTQDTPKFFLVFPPIFLGYLFHMYFFQNFGNLQNKNTQIVGSTCSKLCDLRVFYGNYIQKTKTMFLTKTNYTFIKKCHVLIQSWGRYQENAHHIALQEDWKTTDFHMGMLTIFELLKAEHKNLYFNTDSEFKNCLYFFLSSGWPV